jgi:predicted GIY-YIG superfamily endonuclease
MYHNIMVHLLNGNNNMKAIIGCYIFRFKDSDKFYIGSTKDFKNRKHNHLYMLRNNRHKNPKVQECYNNNPSPENIDWKVFIIDDREKAYTMEEEFLKMYKDDPLMLNSSLDARSTISGLVRTKEWKEKVSNSMKEKFKNVEYYERHKRLVKENWNKEGRKELRSGGNNPFAKPIIIDGVLYTSVNEASRILNQPVKFIRRRTNDLLFDNYNWFTGNESEYERKYNEDFEFDKDKINRNLAFTDKDTEYMKSRLGKNNPSSKFKTIKA